MKKLILSVILIILYAVLGAKKVHAWFGATHEDIVEKALSLLEKEKKHKAVGFYKPWHKQILIGSRQPDLKGDIDNGRGTHYYSCVSARGKALVTLNGYYKNRLGKTMRSARTFFEENYTCAVNLYKKGDIENAMRYLGRAIHFMSDIGCTVHASNMVSIEVEKNPHYMFEKYANSVCSNIRAESLDKRLEGSYQKDKGEAINRLCEFSSCFRADVKGLDVQGFERTAKALLPCVQQNAVALMLMFYNDCHEDNKNYIDDSKWYTIINSETGDVLSADSRKAVLKRYDKNDDKNRFKVEIASDGSFSLKAQNGCYIDTNGRYVNVNADKLPRFRAAAVGENVFRISSQNSGYKKVLSSGAFGRLCAERFDPSDLSQHWVFR